MRLLVPLTTIVCFALLGCAFEEDPASLLCATEAPRCPAGYRCGLHTNDEERCFAVDCQEGERLCDDGTCVSASGCCAAAECEARTDRQAECHQGECRYDCPTGLVLCGTECVDARFAPTGDGCDPVTQCGCSDTQTCHPTEHSNQVSSLCLPAGRSPEGARCTGNNDCGHALACYHNTCVPYCDPQRPATCDGMCIPNTYGSGLCFATCDFPNDASNCQDSQSCAKPAGTSGICIHRDLSNECRHQNDGICSGPSGANLCARDEDDAEDCCAALSLSYGDSFECDPISQCGCGDGETCRLATSFTGTRATCQTAGPLAYGQPCDTGSQCQAGSNCYEGVCTHFCRPGLPGNGCDGECVDVSDSEKSIGICFESCKVAEDSCTGPTQCVLTNEQTDDGRCAQQYPPGECPTVQAGTRDNRCDGPIVPFSSSVIAGTGRCADPDDDPDCAKSITRGAQAISMAVQPLSY